ncbi:uncharacterized protein DUF1524 [Pasteurella langaaensis DSM 22999]|uniref:Uncharacterized protein DUF1524 n=1 Tax=Alitibacter langaaensis DSM 22999 TaxID=1122935 RepID=A0A2U0TGY5_9PAST|nr:HNH endonuclease family protein [Pasteurella langaaensis]PVX42872.1 uncharacterized protein DUF1524 [Pasteurella langaaensis DSM 22999]
MFIFQNNRGKKTSNLEIVKAKFMFYINLYGGEDKEILIEDVQEKFKTIYESISHFNDYVINEDEVLLYSLRVYFNSLWESNPLERIDKELKIDKNHNKNDSLEFISKFTNEMSNDFNNMVTFFNNDERESPKIHSLIALNRIGVVMPFILKAYRYRIGMKKTEELCELFENIILRHRIISTRADLNSRLNDAFKAFSVENKSIDSIVDTINELKTSNKKENYWWNYWNNESLKESLEGALDHNIAKFILWKYENYLRNKINSVTGYKNFLRYEDVEKPELEHIAPRVPKEKPSNGYGKYDDKFKEAYLDCLGNYLLISKSHNCSIGNKPFKEKLSSYDGSVLEQQKEIEKFANENKNKDKIWGKMAIRDRRKKIIEFIKETYF